MRRSRVSWDQITAMFTWELRSRTTVVSRAFQILSDEDKKSKYDRFGGDPDSRFQPGPSASSGASPFSGFGGGGFPGGGARFDEEISAEEMFNRFFNGGFGGMGGRLNPLQSHFTWERLVPVY